MSLRSKRVWIWAVVSALAALIAIPISGPMLTAWRCYRLYETGIRERAEVVAKLEHATLALSIVAGPHAAQACTADTSQAIYEEIEVGDALEVVYVEAKPGECELTSTIAASGKLLGFITAVLIAILAGLIALGITLSRSFAQPAFPSRRMRVDPAGVRCHACGGAMAEGYLPLVSAVQWRELGEPIGMPHALKGLPGTVGWRSRPRLHAYRCAACEIVSFQYGNPSDRESSMP